MSNTDVATDETYDLISSDKVEGTAVYNANGERLGSIYNVMIEKRSGRVAYAILSVGGFLGIGEEYHPLPWSVLTYDTSLGGYRVDLDRKQLEGAPRFPRGGEPDWSNRRYYEDLNRYYGVERPYV